ncbi:MAG TPA: arsenite efflux MFS transporter ArsK [Methylomirabilota bacterium]|nr:arsenite efflux MFS transporter ArsK [Methylomirabilota bacterium]
MTGRRRRSPLASPGAVVAILGATQIIGYGTLYYSFAILADSVAAEFRWPVSWVFGAFSLALFAGGAVAPLVGRRIDRHGAGPVMALGSLAAGAALVLAALAPDPRLFAAALVAVEIASATILYDAAFAALVQLCRHRAGARITHLTLIAGFASTLFWPFTTWLHGHLDWRDVLLVFAVLNIAVCFPLHLAIARTRPFDASPDGAAERPGAAASIVDPPLPPILARRVALLITAGFALSGFLLSAMLTQMVPVLSALGLGSAALVVATLFGPAQVLVRFVNMLFGVRRHPLVVTIVAVTMLPLAVTILAASAPLVAGAAVFAVLLGFGSGLKSIVQGSLPLALFGGAAYGARLGEMALARQFLAASAPFVFAWMVDAFGPGAALMVLVAVAGLGLAAFIEVARIRTRVAASANRAAPDVTSTRAILRDRR